jgi:hypothetical protein
MDKHEVAALRAYTLRVGAATAFVFAGAVLRLVMHALRLSCGGWCDLEENTLRVK